MRATVQRVSSASVEVDGAVCGQIGAGLLVYVGLGDGDGAEDLDYIADKISTLRIFPDGQGKMNLDVGQAGGKVLVVSAFTLQADARKGRRPSFDGAAKPEAALEWYGQLCDKLAAKGLKVARGKFKAMMLVQSVNDGPICVLLDSKRGF